MPQETQFFQTVALPVLGLVIFLYLNDKGKEGVDLGSEVTHTISAHLLLVGKYHMTATKCKGKKLGNTALGNIQEEGKINLCAQLSGPAKASSASLHHS